MFIHCTQNEKKAWLDSAEDSILSAHPSSEQSVLESGDTFECSPASCLALGNHC